MNHIRILAQSDCFPASAWRPGDCLSAQGERGIAALLCLGDDGRHVRHLARCLAVAGLPDVFPDEFPNVGTMQNTFVLDWIPSFDISYSMGVDGISLPLVILTTFICFLAMAASWSVDKYVKAYCILFLMLETAMIGVFLALDFFLFFVFWEVMLLPMYFLIGVWGGPRREYAAIKFFLYTLVGGVLMLVAILMLYFKSDLRELADISDLYGDNPNPRVVWSELHVSEAVTKRLIRSDKRRSGTPHVQHSGAGGHGAADGGLQSSVAVVGIPSVVHWLHH